jgi:hypothetical protein
VGERYQKVATQTLQEIEKHKDIEMHTRMPADCNQTVVKNPKAGENPDAKNMRLDCEKSIKASEALPAEGHASAKLHTLRAKEEEGK